MNVQTSSVKASCYRPVNYKGVKITSQGYTIAKINKMVCQAAEQGKILYMMHHSGSLDRFPVKFARSSGTLPIGGIQVLAGNFKAEWFNAEGLIFEILDK